MLVLIKPKIYEFSSTLTQATMHQAGNFSLDYNQDLSSFQFWGNGQPLLRGILALCVLGILSSFLRLFRLFSDIKGGFNIGQEKGPTPRIQYDQGEQFSTNPPTHPPGGSKNAIICFLAYQYIRS